MQLTAARLANMQNSNVGSLTVCQIDRKSERGNHVIFRQVSEETLLLLGADILESYSLHFKLNVVEKMRARKSPGLSVR